MGCAASMSEEQREQQDIVIQYEGDWFKKVIQWIDNFSRKGQNKTKCGNFMPMWKNRYAGIPPQRSEQVETFFPRVLAELIVSYDSLFLCDAYITNRSSTDLNEIIVWYKPYSEKDFLEQSDIMLKILITINIMRE